MNHDTTFMKSVVAIASHMIPLIDEKHFIAQLGGTSLSKYATHRSGAYYKNIMV